MTTQAVAAADTPSPMDRLAGQVPTIAEARSFAADVIPPIVAGISHAYAFVIAFSQPTLLLTLGWLALGMAVALLISWLAFAIAEMCRPVPAN